jgi:superfamily II DNA or RNA helicase
MGTLTRNGLVIPGTSDIKKDLTVRAVENAMGIQTPSFKIYRTIPSSTSLVVPRYWSGEPPSKDTRRAALDARGINFVGKLRKETNQLEAFSAGLKAFEERGGGVLSLPPGYGKCLGKDTPVMMFDGSVKKVQDIQAGEIIMGDDSEPRNVLSTCTGQEQLYKVVPVKGDSYIVNESHILSCMWSEGKSKKHNEIKDISVKDYLQLPKKTRERWKGYRVPITFQPKEVSLDPYMVGYWLGDGGSKSTIISSQDSKVLHYFSKNLSQHKLHLSYISQYDYRIMGPKPNYFYKTLKDLNLLENKHIPHIYKCNSRDVQLQVLAGLMDSDGSAISGGWDFIQKNERLFDDVLFLARSLGFACYKQKCFKTCTNSKGGPNVGTYYRCTISGAGVEQVPCKIDRKKVAQRTQTKNVLKTGIKLEKLDIGEYFGFEIDGNHRFVLGDFTVTHNTTMALAYAGHLKTQTMIVVHKEFLANQWRDRIHDFCPGASIGRVQGPEFDVEGKDFVIALIQTMCQREFPKDAFDSIGLLIVDEAHHIGAPAFSQFMFKICPKFTLGLTATPERKDGLTRLLYWFLGPEFFRVERTAQKSTRVQTLHYMDEAFREAPPVTRFGKINMAGMVSVLTELDARNELLLKTIEEALACVPPRRVLVLSDRREHCFYLHEKIGSKSGLYIGGRKEEELSAASEKPVVIATFQLAQEGLDIPALDTVILSTPKSDIKQSIGRIMRETPGKLNSPLIYDIIDHWSVFYSMARKRRKVYEEGGFAIENEEPEEPAEIIGKGQCFFF